jgi:ubiquinone/menaquinone biosynthesis C-methylase UbiE
MSIEYWKHKEVLEGAYGYQFTNPEIIKALNIQKNTVLLEIGANYGRDTRQFAKMTDNLYAIDINSAYKERLLKYTPNVYISENGIKYPFKSNMFDVIYACHVIEHIEKEKLESLLKEIKRILKNDGIFCFDIWSGVYENISDNYLDTNYIDNGYSELEMKQILEPYFEIINIQSTKDISAINCSASPNAKVVWYIVKKRDKK